MIHLKKENVCIYMYRLIHKLKRKNVPRLPCFFTLSFITCKKLPAKNKRIQYFYCIGNTEMKKISV